jgi:hypothetical protein
MPEKALRFQTLQITVPFWHGPFWKGGLCGRFILRLLLIYFGEDDAKGRTFPRLAFHLDLSVKSLNQLLGDTSSNWLTVSLQ